MKITPQKYQRLADVAARYYLQQQDQSVIANALGVSRPLVSRMLSEARMFGIVEFVVHFPGEPDGALLKKLRQTAGLQGGVLVPDDVDDHLTNRALSQGVVTLLGQLSTRRLGVGWGHIIGQLVAWLEENPQPQSSVQEICPLVGNAGFPIRNYHSSENVRLLAQQLGATPHFLYLPALPESLEEKQVLCSTELYQQIQQQWSQMDTALVNISNYPSTPDFASVARYGDSLQRQQACGRMLAYYFNAAGELICSDQDFAIQIPLQLLRECPRVVGVCSANTGVKALRGALRTGRFTHIVARAQLVQAALEETEEQP